MAVRALRSGRLGVSMMILQRTERLRSYLELSLITLY
jgi:hypothetical protein